MYAAVRRYQVPPGSIDEIVQQAKTDFVPIISKVPGLVAYYFFSAENNMVVAISIFEDQAAAEEYLRQTANWKREKVATDATEVIEGQVLIHVAT